MKGVFITGTGTGVGKTYFTALLTRSLRKQGIPAIPLKPISSGDRVDSIRLSEATQGEISPAEINPVHLSVPLSPYAACILEGRPFPWGILREKMQKIAAAYSGPFLVEGAGGWRTPLDPTHSIREWAQELALPVIVVARAGLGTLNHTLLTIDSIRQSGLAILGIVLNENGTPTDDATRTNPALIAELTQKPVLILEEGASGLQIPDWLLL